MRSGLTSTCAVWTCAIGAAMTIACGGGNQPAAESNANAAAESADAPRDQARVPVEVRGCLTAAGDRFVLTALRTSTGETTTGSTAAGNNTATAASNGGAGDAIPTTESYQLTVADQSDLRQYVGREVRVVGDADAPQVAQVQETTPSAPAVATSGQQRSQTAAEGPTVKSVTETRLEVRRLAVGSVTPTGNECPAEGSGATTTR